MALLVYITGLASVGYCLYKVEPYLALALGIYTATSLMYNAIRAMDRKASIEKALKEAERILEGKED